MKLGWAELFNGTSRGTFNVHRCHSVLPAWGRYKDISFHQIANVSIPIAVGVGDERAFQTFR